MPFNGEGILVLDHPELQGNSPRAVKLRAVADKRLKQAIKAHEKALAKAAGAPPADDDDEPEAESTDSLSDGELIREWLRGRDE